MNLPDLYQPPVADAPRESLAEPADFFEQVHLNKPALGGVAEAVSREDWDDATKALAGIFRQRGFASPLLQPTTVSDAQETIRRADEAVQLKIGDAGESPFAFDGRIIWRESPVTTICRFPHFEPLTAAYEQAKHPKYANAIVRDIRDYIASVSIEDAMPLHVKGNRNGRMFREGNPWQNNYLLVRFERWLRALHAVRDSPELTDEDLLSAIRCIIEDARWAKPQIEAGFPAANNLKLAMARYLIEVGLLLPEMAIAPECIASGRDLFTSLVMQSVYPDGAYDELTIGYSISTINSMCRLMLAMPGDKALHAVRDRILQAIRYNMALTRPTDGMPPAYGDVNPFVLARDELVEHAQRLGLHWVAHVATSGRKSEPPDFTAFPPAGESQYGGYYVMRDGFKADAMYMVIDGGPCGTNHVHMDKLSFEMCAMGQPFIVDPGSCGYFTQDEDTDSDRHVNLSYGYHHNNLTINGVDQTETRNRSDTPLQNRWEPGLADGRIDIFESSYRFDQAVHLNNPGEPLLPIEHRRRVVFVRGVGWLMEDVLTGDMMDVISVEQQFQCPATISPRQLAENHWQLISAAGPVLHVVGWDATWQGRVAIGETEPPVGVNRDSHHWNCWTNAGRGWCAQPMSKRGGAQPSPMLLFQAKLTLPHIRRVWFAPARSVSDSVTIARVDAADVIKVSGHDGPVTLRSTTDELSVV